MGVHTNVGFETFPEQGIYLHKQVEVTFNYDATRNIFGRIVRDDVQEPFLTIIALHDNRHVLGTECQYRPVD